MVILTLIMLFSFIFLIPFSYLIKESQFYFIDKKTYVIEINVFHLIIYRYEIEHYFELSFQFLRHFNKLNYNEKILYKE